MSTKTFLLKLIDGHPIIEDNGNTILIDTGSPATIHNQGTLNFMGTDFPSPQAYGPLTIPGLSDLLQNRVTTLVGMDILGHYKIIFDYPDNLITFSNDDDLTFEGEIVHLRRVLSIPVIDAIINNRTIPCFLDSGAKLSYLKTREIQNFQNLGNVGDFYPGAGRFQTSTFEIETQVGDRIFSVVYGNLPRHLEDQLLILVGGNNGIIGYDFLKKFKIYMDATSNDLRIAY